MNRMHILQEGCWIFKLLNHVLTLYQRRMHHIVKEDILSFPPTFISLYLKLVFQVMSCDTA